MPKSRDELKRTMPTLRSRFESSRALIERAHETAARVVEAADAMRTLLHQEHETHPPTTSPQKDLWEAAAHEILHGARERDRILGLLSHELCQALATAIAAERLLQVTEDRDAAGRARAVLHRQLQHLSRLVEDLLEFSQISLEMTSMQCRAINVDDVIAETAELMESVIAQRAQQLTLTKAASPPIVNGDPSRLQQIFSSLLHNASRYTPRGGHIEVESFVEPGWTRVEIRDDGNGIEPSRIAVIFDPFKRGSAESPGLGIGLSLARRLAELHGGTITARSDGRDRGSTFTVRLPLVSQS